MRNLCYGVFSLYLYLYLIIFNKFIYHRFCGSKESLWGLCKYIIINFVLAMRPGFSDHYEFATHSYLWKCFYWKLWKCFDSFRMHFNSTSDHSMSLIFLSYLIFTFPQCNNIRDSLDKSLSFNFSLRFSAYCCWWRSKFITCCFNKR